MCLCNPPSGKSVAIVGRGSGLRRAITLGLAATYHDVYRTAFGPKNFRNLADASNGKVRWTLCEMTSEEGVKALVLLVASGLRRASLNALINNAGSLTPGSLEALLLAAIRQDFEVNVFVALSVINTFLPQLHSLVRVESGARGSQEVLRQSAQRMRRSETAGASHGCRRRQSRRPELRHWCTQGRFHRHEGCWQIDQCHALPAVGIQDRRLAEHWEQTTRRRCDGCMAEAPNPIDYLSYQN